MDFGENRFSDWNWDYKLHSEKYGQFMTYNGNKEHYKKKYKTITGKILSEFKLINKKDDRRLYEINGKGIVKGLGYCENPDWFENIIKISITKERIFVEYEKGKWYSSTLFWINHINISNHDVQAGIFWC